MSDLTLDGSTRYVGTEFIKLEATGSSNLATEAFATTAVANGGGGGGGTETHFQDTTGSYTDTTTAKRSQRMRNKVSTITFV